MLTAVEWAKLNPTPLQSGVVEIIASNNPVIEHMPFVNVAGNAYKYNQEDQLPGVAFRGIGDSYVESTGVILPQTEALTILGGDSDYDVAHIAMQTGDNDTRAVFDAMKSKAVALTHLRTFFDGDTTAEPLEFDGLNVRLTGDQVIEAGTDGAELTLAMLDDLVDAVNGTPTVLLMNKKLRTKVRQLARNVGALTITRDFLGREVDGYAGIPFGIVEDGPDGNPILGFDEEQGTATNSASIYAVRFGIDGMHGIQTAPISVRDLGEIDAKPALRTRIEWYSGIAFKHPKAAARLRGITLN